MQQRRQRRRVQKTCIVESQPTDHSTTQSDDSNTDRHEQEPRILSTAQGTPGRKRSQQEIEAEDRAATEIVDLVAHEVQHSAGTTTGASPAQATHIPVNSVAMNPVEEEAIPEWVITESREKNREVTPPVQLFSRPGRTTGRGLRAGGCHWHPVLYLL